MFPLPLAGEGAGESPFFAKPEMGPSDFGSEKLATSLPSAACVRPASARAHHFAVHPGFHNDFTPVRLPYVLSPASRPTKHPALRLRGGRRTPLVRYRSLASCAPSGRGEASSQAVQKFQQVGLFIHGKHNRPAAYQAAIIKLLFQRLRQGGYTTVVHVRRSTRHITQTGRLEFTDLLGISGDQKTTQLGKFGIPLRIPIATGRPSLKALSG